MGISWSSSACTAASALSIRLMSEVSVRRDRLTALAR
jgi:hypothetical protein